MADETVSESNRPKFKVDWTLNPSHILAFLGVLYGGLLFMWGMREDIAKANSIFERTVVEQKAKNEMQDDAIRQIKDANIVSRTEETQFRSEMRNSMAELTKILTDVRINAEHQEKRR